MATNKKITQLDELTPATWADDDVIAIVDISAQETKKIQLSTFRGAVTGVSTLNASTPLTVDSATGDVTISVAINGGGTINAVFDEDDMTSNSPTALATQQSIKAYVDSQVGTVDTLAEILSNGNTSGGTNIVVSSGDVITTNTINETTAASGVTIDSLLVKDGGITAAGTSTFAGQTITNLGAVTTADINGGTIDGTVIGGSTPAAISGTTGSFSGNLTVDTNTLFVDAANNRVGIVTSSPATQLEVNGTIRTSGTVPILSILDTTAATDEKEWHIRGADGPLRFAAINEASGASGDFVEFTRVGNSGKTIRGVRSGVTSYELSNFDRSLFFSGGVSTIGTATAHDLVFDTNNAERMRITSNGNVGINTSSPGEKLTVSGNMQLLGSYTDFSDYWGSGSNSAFFHPYGFIGSNGAFKLSLYANGYRNTSSSFTYMDINGNTNTAAGIDLNPTGEISFSTGTASGASLPVRMTIDSSGKVGIGTASPDSGTPLHVQESSASLGANPTASAFLVERAGTVAMTLGTANTGTASIFFGDPENLTGGRVAYDNSNNALQFWANAAERMRIDSSGNVGIGTSSPSKTLDVDGQLRIRNGGATGYALLEYGASATATNNWHVGSEGDGTYRFYNGNFGAGAERMRITSSGNVGIGTAAPSQKLTVSGNIALIGGGNMFSAATSSSYSIAGGNTFNNGGSIRFGGSTSGAVAGGLIFNSGAGATNSERMRITSAGNVGIGTSSPSNVLTVSSATQYKGFTLTNGTNTVAELLGFAAGNDSGGLKLHSGGVAKAQVLAGGTSFFNGGNVGIGTSSPSTLLHLASTGNAILTLEADTDNVSESDNARIELSQDGGATTGHMGYGSGTNGIDIWNDYSDYVRIGTNNVERLRVVNNGVVRPATDNAQTLGAAANRWSVVYAGTGTINTSDEREKQQIADLDDAERRVAVAIKGLVKKYKYNDAVALKGDDARIHVGVIAQEVIAAFAAEGLDATHYALLCHDTWEAEPEEVDKNGNVINPGIEAGERYGIRYDELLAFMIAAL